MARAAAVMPAAPPHTAIRYAMRMQMLPRCARAAAARARRWPRAKEDKGVIARRERLQVSAVYVVTASTPVNGALTKGVMVVIHMSACAGSRVTPHAPQRGCGRYAAAPSGVIRPRRNCCCGGDTRTYSQEGADRQRDGRKRRRDATRVMPRRRRHVVSPRVALPRHHVITRRRSQPRRLRHASARAWRNAAGRKRALYTRARKRYARGKLRARRISVCRRALSYAICCRERCTSYIMRCQQRRHTVDRRGVTRREDTPLPRHVTMMMRARRAASIHHATHTPRRARYAASSAAARCRAGTHI